MISRCHLGVLSHPSQIRPLVAIAEREDAASPIPLPPGSKGPMRMPRAASRNLRGGMIAAVDVERVPYRDGAVGVKCGRCRPFAATGVSARYIGFHAGGWRRSRRRDRRSAALFLGPVDAGDGVVTVEPHVPRHGQGVVRGPVRSGSGASGVRRRDLRADDAARRHGRGRRGEGSRLHDARASDLRRPGRRSGPCRHGRADLARSTDRTPFAVRPIC